MNLQQVIDNGSTLNKDNEINISNNYLDVLANDSQGNIGEIFLDKGDVFLEARQGDKYSYADVSVNQAQLYSCDGHGNFTSIQVTPSGVSINNNGVIREL